MSKTAVVFWSATGNTENMADCVVKGAAAAGSAVSKYQVSSFNESMIENFDAIAFGCPAMGAEMLEDCEFEPVFTACLPYLSGKKVALFGSYGWGDGEWMRTWEETCREAGITLAADSVICEGSPDTETGVKLNRLGAALSK